MNIYLKQRQYSAVLLLRAFMIFFWGIGMYAQDHSGEFLKALTPQEYDKWESVRGAKFSDDGSWLSVITGTNQGDRTLKLRNLATGDELHFQDVNGIDYSPDNTWVVLRRTLPGEQLQTIREVNGEIEARAWLYSLETKDTVTVNNLRKYAFSANGAFLAMTRNGDRGKSLTIRNMADGREISFGNVADFDWHQEKNLLLFQIKNLKGDHEIQLYNALTGSIKVLDSHAGDYVRMYWLDESADAVVVREHPLEDQEEVSHDLFIFKRVDKADFTVEKFQPHVLGSLKDHQRVLAEDLVLAEDQSKLYFKVVTGTPAPVVVQGVASDSLHQFGSDEALSSRPVFYNKHHEAPDLQIWHSNDKVLVPAQYAKGIDASAVMGRAVWDFEKKEITFLQDDILEDVIIEKEQRVFLGYDETPYEREVMFGRHFYDVYAIDATTGTRKKLVEKVSKYYELSPDSRYFVYLKDDHLHLYDLDRGASVNLTKGVGVSFIDEHNDHPLPQKPAYGFVGWAEDGRSLLLNSEFDVWQFFTGKKPARRLTAGMEQENVFRLDFTSKNGGTIDLSKPLFYSVEGKWTKKSGYAQGRAGSKTTMLIFEDASVRRIARNDRTADMIFVRSSFDLPGDAYYTQDMFATEKPLTAINAFQDEYRWSKAELVDYQTALGNRAQGVLYYPADYVEGKKYPMITYVYEKLSHGLHNYMQPSENDYYNTLLWSQAGYFVFKPDMEFEAGNPGVSAARTLENAVGAVVAKGDVDKDKVGLIGHSWGGYQAGFVPTQTDIFAASVAGAGLTDLVSMNLSVTPAFGWRPENDHFEVGQERMAVAPWVAPEKYVANSTVMQIHKLNTPVMFMTGDSDNNVNWSQGIAYYNAARRAGKDFVLLVYEGEGHSLSQKKNQIDYQQRILKWFGYHLKGEAPEDWMLNSVPYSEQQKRLENWGEE
ncbi:prolyl oligopeptidase family serine peptidase [Robertkochia sediminum]|uniref:prolyl oligopeptidase family serine peptidase n=1 Tax=Robertkochia sediminum TaxID=2785326 RepID=UPI0019335012|nr:prolyl oligopeptidase family serine peptidase [Robertkochia sediminum]MBL7473216.1 prolyl oligopeptidase family serine peptidase [Robertkochia sediminum]